MRKYLLASCVGAFAAFAVGGANANDELLKMSQNPKDWVMPTGDYFNQRYSKLNQINSSNVGKLQVAWTFSTGVLRGHEGAPLVIGNVMYLHTPFPNIVYALDLANDGKILWKYEPKQDPNVIPVMCCDTVNRGLAYGGGKIFLHQADTTLVALNAMDGTVAWTAKNGRLAPRLRWRSRTRFWSARRVANSVCNVRLPPTTSIPASWCGAVTRKGRMISCSLTTRPPRWASRLARTPA